MSKREKPAFNPIPDTPATAAAVNAPVAGQGTPTTPQLAVVPPPATPAPVAAPVTDLVVPAAGQPADLGYLSALAKTMAGPKGKGKPVRQRATIDLDSDLYDRITLIATLNKSTMRDDVEAILMRAYFPERATGQS